MSTTDTMTTPTDFMAEWKARLAYYEERAAGKHDEGCEWREEGHFLCHCAKRRRIASGFTKPPGPLIIHYPTCPRCDNEVGHNGDGFECATCKVTWSSTDESDEGDFGDDYGDLVGHVRIDAARLALRTAVEVQLPEKDVASEPPEVTGNG